MARLTLLPTEVRRRLQHVLRTRNFRSALRSNTGAIDLASIMVGVIVIGVIAGVIAATVFAVIPWAQDKAASASVDSVGLAESVARVNSDRYNPMAQLISDQMIQKQSTVTAITDAAGSCYISASKSSTGAIFYGTSKAPGATKYVPNVTEAATSWCAPFSTILSDFAGAPAAAGTSSDRLEAAQAAYFAANGSYTADVSALEALTGTPILVSGESMKIVRSILPSYTNLIPDGSLEAGSASSRFSGGQAGATFAAGTDGGADGSSYVRMTQATAGNLDAVSSIYLAALPVSSTSVAAHAQQNQLSANGNYTLTAKLRTSMASLGGLTMKAQFFNASGTSLGTLGTNRSITAVAGAWTIAGGNLSGAIPTGAASMKAIVSTTNWVGAGAKIDIDSISITSGNHNFTSSDSTKPERFGFPSWFQSRAGGYVAMIRAADGTTTAVTSAIAVPFAFFNSQWTPATGGFTVTAGSDFPTTQDAVNGLPFWVLNEGITVDDGTWWDLTSSNPWLVKP
jgi:hypothetical protein